MATEPNALRSRRALLAAAAGSAAAVVASAALPLTTAAHDADDMQLAAVNASPGTTQLNCTPLDVDAFVVNAANANTGSGIVAAGAHAPGIRTYSGEQAALYAINGDESGAVTATGTITTGVYGFAETAPDPTVTVGVGVWGDSPDWGVFGSGAVGVYGWGANGVVGESSSSSAGVLALGKSATDVALEVVGRVRFSRSGKVTMAANTKTKVVNLPGMSSSCHVLAVLRSNRGCRWVRAVVPTTGHFTIYLNTAVTSSTSVAWFVLN